MSTNNNAASSSQEAFVQRMVERFLQWRLPDDFHPDAGISFTPDFNVGTAHPMRHQPLGTNLLTAAQAEGMIRYLLADAGFTARSSRCDVDWPEQAVRIAEELEHRVTETRGDSLWCTLCQQDIGADGRQHADTCLLANSVEGSAV